MGIGAYFVFQKIQKTPEKAPEEAEEEVSEESVQNIPYYFIAVHNEPSHFPDGEERIAQTYSTLKQMIEKANEYNIKLTLMLSAPWADYISESSERIADLKSWEKQGHEIAAHHHGIRHNNWDGYTDYSEEEAKAARIKKDVTPEDYLGTLEDYIEHLRKINPKIHSGCTNEESDKNEMPDEIIYSTCSGFLNYGEPGRREGDGVPGKGKNEYITVSTWKGIQRKWLTHYQVYRDENAGEGVFNSMSFGVYGVVVHSNAEQAEKLYTFMEFLHSKDPSAEKSETLTEIIEQKLLPEKEISEDLLK